ncbi:BA71V-L60L [African swine fever virus]|nr:BA71V-L60L [African swine fever virus]
MGDTLSKQMSSTETLSFKEEQAHCNNKTSENQPKIIDDNKCTDSQNTDSQNTDSQNTDSQDTDSQNTDSSKVYSIALNKDWHLYVMI